MGNTLRRGALLDQWRRRRWQSALVSLIVGLHSICACHSARAELVGLEPITGGLFQPNFVTHAPGDRNRIFVAQKNGDIRIIDLATNTILPTPFLTIPDTKSIVESGLVGMTFHPNYAENHKFYVYVTADNGGVMIDGIQSPLSSHVREYTADPNSNVANATYKTIWSSVRPDTTHVAGWIGFSPIDNYLYVMSGDGGHAIDSGPGHTPATGNAQDLTDNHFGKVLRIDVNGDDFPDDPERNYAIPATNPYVGIEGDDEIWANGLRNPYRASFDRATGDLWIADVGQAQREEINFQPASSDGGENYGWVLREGSLPGIGGTRPPNNVDPVYDYGRGANPSTPGPFEGRTTIGGYVYRGPDPELQGKFIFGDAGIGDVASRRFWMFDPADIPTQPGDPPLAVEDLASVLTTQSNFGRYPVSFGEDAVGNLYVTFYFSGEVFRLKTDAFIPGDFDADGDVDDADLAEWTSGFGMTANAKNSDGDADRDGDVDGADFLAWQTNYGQAPLSPATPTTTNVPEPATVVLAMGIALFTCSMAGNRRRSSRRR